MVLFSYVRGIAVNLEAGRQAEAETGVSEGERNASSQEQFVAIASSRRYAGFARLLDELKDGFEFGFEQVLEFGLEPVLDGIARLVQKTQRGG